MSHYCLCQRQNRFFKKKPARPHWRPRWCISLSKSIVFVGSHGFGSVFTMSAPNALARATDSNFTAPRASCFYTSYGFHYLSCYFGSFNLSRNCLLGRKVIICRLVMVIDSPVFGLRPRRGDLSRTFRLPNWTNLMEFPLIKVFFKVAKTVSTIFAAFR